MPSATQPAGLAEDGRAQASAYIQDNVARPATKAPIQPLALGSLVALLDAVAIGGAGLAADALAASDGAQHAPVVALVVALSVLFGAQLGAYSHGVLFHAMPQLRKALTAWVGALGVTLLAAALLGAAWRLDVAWLAFAIPLTVLSLAAGRAAVGGLLRQEVHARTARRAVILGAGPQADRLASAMRRQGPGAIRLLGLVDERGPRADAAPDGVADLGGLPALFQMIRRDEVDLVVVAVPWQAEGRVADLLHRLSAYPIEVRLAPDLVTPGGPVARTTPVPLRPLPIHGWNAAMKRTQDIVLALGAMTVAAIPMALIALAVRLDSPGPVFFRQRRTGFNDQSFDVLKFRTMYADAADHDVVRQVRAGDPRVTRVGAILRRTSLDELPQLLNVLRGEMSFVGPRPHAPGTRAGTRRFDEVVANYSARHCVKPGLTGLAQVRGYRGPTATEDQVIRRVESDLEYIENWSLRLDMVIILRTLWEVARMRNAV